MIKKIYLTRHGQTDFNLKGIVQGRGVNAGLNDMGRAQAQAFHEAYGHLKFDKLYVSSLMRTHQSMKGFIDAGLDYEELAGLDEISWGVHEGMEINPAQHAYYFEMINRWQNGETHLAIEGGESPEMLAIRLKEALDHIMRNKNERQILICMHGRAMRLFLAIILNYPYKAMDYFEHNNLGLYELTFNGNTFKLDNYNDTNHLKHL